MVKKSAKSVKKAPKKAAKRKIDTSFNDELRSAAKASALKRLKKFQ